MILFLAALLSASVWRGDGAARAAEATPVFSGEIVIGATLPLTGYLETYGQSAYYGATTSVRIINAAGGVNGKKLVLEWRDNRSDTAKAMADVEELVRNHTVPAIVGPLLSDSALAVMPLAERLEVVVVTPMATMDALTHDDPWLFRACFSNTDQADAMARFQMEKFGATTCGILYDPRHAFSSELAGVFARRFKSAGGRVLGIFPISSPGGGMEYESALGRLRELAPDFVFAPCYALEATEIIRAARRLDIGLRFCGPLTWDNELVFDASGTRLEGTAIVSTLFEREFSYRPFRIFYDAMELAGMDTPDAQAASAFDAVSLIARGLENGETARQVRDGLLAIRRLPLATGRLTFTGSGEARKPVLIRLVERRNGRMVPVYAERYDPPRDRPSRSGRAEAERREGRDE